MVQRTPFWTAVVRAFALPSQRRGWSLFSWTGVLDAFACLNFGMGLVRVFIELAYWLTLKYSRAPDLLLVVEGGWPWRAPPRCLRLGPAARCVQ